MEPKIILKTGNLINLSVFQQQKKLPADKVAPHFSVSEMSDTGYFHISETLLNVLELFREKSGEPVILNSAYRSQIKQSGMRKSNKHAAKNSPHPEGMAADIETKTKIETADKAAILDKISHETGINMRIGYESYLLDGMTFIHVDVTPEYFAEGKPYNSVNHPWQWEVEARW